MALGSASMAYGFAGTLIAISPFKVFPLIAKGPVEYLVSILFLAGLGIVGGLGEIFLASSIPIAGPLLTRLIAFYMLIAEMKVIGLVYGCNANIPRETAKSTH